jgi:hypothetical protein
MRRNSHTLRGFLSIRCWRVDIADVAITGTRQNSVIYTGPFGEKGGPCDVSKLDFKLAGFRLGGIPM